MLSYWQTESDFLSCFDKQNLHVSFALSTFRFSDFVELLFPVLQAFLGKIEMVDEERRNNECTGWKGIKKGKEKLQKIIRSVNCLQSNE